MRVEIHGSASRFLSEAGPFLSSREAEHNLHYGIAERAGAHPDLYGKEPPWFAVVRDAGEVVAAALRTPPHPVIVSRIPAPALDPLVAAVRARGPLTGVVGPAEAADAFAGSWDARIGSSMDQLLYELTELAPPSGVPGFARVAGPGDVELLGRWIVEFGRDVGEPLSADDAARRAELYVREGCARFWVDVAPVSMAAWQGPTPRGVRIGAVYTPKEHRRRGYAGAVTAAVTAERLASGRAYCFLFTDAGNPTSNSVYRKLGYRPIGVFRRHRFAAP